MIEVRGRLVPDTLEEIADPKHTALLVVDIQNDNASDKGLEARSEKDISRARAIVPRVKVVLGEARRLGVPVVFLRMTESTNGSVESDPVLRRVAKASFAGEFLMEGTWGNEVLDELRPRGNERQILKYRSSSFIGTPLDLFFRSSGIKAAVVVGMVTEGCVEATVRDLDQYGYYPVVLNDCVTSRRKEIHDAALLVMSARYDVVTSDDLLHVWGAHGSVKAGPKA